MPQTKSKAIQDPISTTRNPENIAPLGHPSVNQTVVPVMKSSRKRAVVGSLSPTIRPLAPQDHRSKHLTQGLSHDPLWEARFQEAVRYAMVTLSAPGSGAGLLPHIQPQAPTLPLSIVALKEAEAAHAARGICIQQAWKAQDQMAAAATEVARREAESARREATASRALQAQLQSQLHDLAATDAAAASAFADTHEKLAKESQAIAEKLQQLHNTGIRHVFTSSAWGTRVTPPLPPHLLTIDDTSGVTPVTGQPQHGRTEPLFPATGLAEPHNPATVLADPTKTAPHGGVPQPGEANQE